MQKMFDFVDNQCENISYIYLTEQQNFITTGTFANYIINVYLLTYSSLVIHSHTLLQVTI